MLGVEGENMGVTLKLKLFGADRFGVRALRALLSTSFPSFLVLLGDASYIYTAQHPVSGRVVEERVPMYG